MIVTFLNKYYFPPHLGGIEQVLNLLATNLAKRPGFEVRALVANESATTVRERVEGVDVVRMGRAFAAASTPVVPGMVRAIQEDAVGANATDIFHLHFPYPWGEVSWLRAHISTPTVMTYHSDIVRQKKLMALYAPILNRVLDKMDRIMVASPQMIEHSPYLNPRAEKCKVVPFGIDYSRFDPEPEVEQRIKAQAESFGRPIVLFVGRLVYYKGVEVLIRAMADIDAQLVIIGRGPLDDELHALAEEVGIANRTTWLPPIPDVELGAWYRAASLFCLPSIARTEAFGLVQLEAHSAGTPVVSTNLPTGVPYANADGVTGFTVPVGDVAALADAIRTLIEDDALRRRFGEQAKERAHRDFSIGAMIENTLAVYRELVKLH